MKIIKIEKGDSKVTRKLITKFGESVYHDDNIRGVMIKVFFKDGSSIGFRRDEDEDTLEEIFEKDEDIEE